MKLREFVFGIIALCAAGCSPAPEKVVQVVPPPNSAEPTPTVPKTNPEKVLPPAKPKAVISKPPAPAVITKRSNLFKWAKTREEAKVRAKKTGGYVLLVFQTSWSGQCIIMNREAFQDRTIAKTFAKAVIVPVDTDTKEGLKLSQEYKSEEIPTFVFLKPDGTVIGQFFGFMNVDWLQREVKRVFDRAKFKG